MGRVSTILATCALALSLIMATPCAARSDADDRGALAPTDRPLGDVVFQAVYDLPQQGDAYRPQLRGGQDAVPADWPASFYFKFTSANGPRVCTAALIGPKVMLTAAHCLPPSRFVAFKFGNDGYTARCAPHPDYAKDNSADFALCEILDKPFAAPEGFKYETVRDAGMSLAVGKNKYVLLSGFGCRSDRASDAETADEHYQIGFAEIDESSDSPGKIRGADYYAPLQKNNLFTVYDAGATHANLCPGDSGGPAFILTGGYGTVTQFRTIIAVNSRVFYNKTGSLYRDSLLSATGGPDFRPWAISWLGTKLRACGFKPGPGSSICR